MPSSNPYGTPFGPPAPSAPSAPSAPQNPWHKGSAFGSSSPSIAGTDPNEAARYYTGGGLYRPQAEAEFRVRSERAIGGRTQEAFRLRDVEQGGMDEAKENYRRAMDDIMSPALSDRDVSDLYAGMLEDIAQQKQRDMMAMTEYSGAAGLRGGVASDQLAMVELGALGQVTRGMRDLRKYQADMASQHKITQLNALGMGAQVLPMVSTLGEQALSDLAVFYGGMWGVERGARQAKDASNAAADAAKWSGAFGLAGSAIGLGAGFLG